MAVEQYCLKCDSGNIVDDYDREGGTAIAVRKCLMCGGRRIGERSIIPRPPEIQQNYNEYKPEMTAPEKTDISGPDKVDKRIVSGERKSLTKLVAGSPLGLTNGMMAIKPAHLRQEEISMGTRCKQCVEKNPDSTKYSVKDGLCTICYKEKTGMTPRQALAKERLAAGNIPPDPGNGTGVVTNKKIESKRIKHPLCKRCLEKNPNSTKFGVKDCLCNKCFQEVNGISVKDAIWSQREFGGIKHDPAKNKIPHAKEKVTTLGRDTLIVRFADYPELVEKLAESARKNFRTPEAQILALIDTFA